MVVGLEPETRKAQSQGTVTNRGVISTSLVSVDALTVGERNSLL